MGDRDPMLVTGQLTEEELAQIRGQTRSKAEGGQVSLLIYVRAGVQAVSLEEGRALVIGREAPAGLVVRDPSLSRQHARVELTDAEVWVQDLGSTNGTRIDGQRIERAKLEPGAELALGAVAIHLHTLGMDESEALGLVSHDQLQLQLEAECARARSFGRGLALMMIRSARDDRLPRGWYPGLVGLLRRFDSEESIRSHNRP
jgi:hypothetical protein